MAELGYHPGTPPTSSDTYATAELAAWGPFTMTENGTLTDIVIYCENASAGATIKGMVYEDNGSNQPGNRFAYFADFDPTGTLGWQTISTAITGSTSLVSGSKYHLGFYVVDNASPAINYNFDSGILSPGGRDQLSSVSNPPPTTWGGTHNSSAGDCAGIYIVYTPGAAAVQTAYPTADSVDGNWTNEGDSNVNLYASIDETVASDSDYIKSEAGPVNSGMRIKLGTLTDPASSTGHSISWRVSKSAGGTTMDMTTRLYQGGGDSIGAGTFIQKFDRTNVGTAWTTYTETLAGTAADAITDYSALFLEFYANEH